MSAESEVYRCGQREWISRLVSYLCTCRTEYLPRGFAFLHSFVTISSQDDFKEEHCVV